MSEKVPQFSRAKNCLFGKNNHCQCYANAELERVFLYYQFRINRIVEWPRPLATASANDCGNSVEWKRSSHYSYSIRLLP